MAATKANTVKKPAASAKPAAKKTASPARRSASASTGSGLQEVCNSMAEQQAAALAQAAVWLDQASTGSELGSALQHNLDVWVAIRTMTESPSSALPSDTRGNLIQLADYVAASTLNSAKKALTKEQIRSFININLQISEGLLEGQANKMIREEAYRLWESAGRPTGDDQNFWVQAESTVRKLMGEGKKSARKS
ncbi:MAG: hypothetical protein A2516_09135 [Alphaproteobacteria bacterium RIFOXYD12_FULL_60_8]|nr:MAG: hypothetical protein A2516_09135 [Alphaproteobacteria bacterium RIFOXYD12_FULL_60_8]